MAIRNRTSTLRARTSQSVLKADVVIAGSGAAG
jgi:hypothetical protein